MNPHQHHVMHLENVQEPDRQQSQCDEQQARTFVNPTSHSSSTGRNKISSEGAVFGTQSNSTCAFSQRSQSMMASAPGDGAGLPAEVGMRQGSKAGMPAATHGARMQRVENSNARDEGFCEMMDTGEQRHDGISGNATSQGTTGISASLSRSMMPTPAQPVVVSNVAKSNENQTTTNGINGCLNSPAGSTSSRDTSEPLNGTQNGHGAASHAKDNSDSGFGTSDHKVGTHDAKLTNGPVDALSAEKKSSESAVAESIKRETTEAALSDLIAEKAVIMNGFCEPPNTKSLDSIVSHVGNGDTGAEARQKGLKSSKLDSVLKDPKSENDTETVMEGEGGLTRQSVLENCIRKSENLKTDHGSCEKSTGNCTDQNVVVQQSKCDLFHTGASHLSDCVSRSGSDIVKSQSSESQQLPPPNDIGSQMMKCDGRSVSGCHQPDFHKVSEAENTKQKQKSSLLGELLESTPVEKPAISLNLNSAKAGESIQKKSDRVSVPVGHSSTVQGFIACPAGALSSGRLLGALPGQLPQPYVSASSSTTPMKRPSTEAPSAPHAKRTAPLPSSQRNIPRPVQISSPTSFTNTSAPHSPILKLALEKPSATKGQTSPRRSAVSTPKSVPKMPVATCSRPAATRSSTSQSNTHSALAPNQRSMGRYLKLPADLGLFVLFYRKCMEPIKPEKDLRVFLQQLL